MSNLWMYVKRREKNSASLEVLISFYSSTTLSTYSHWLVHHPRLTQFYSMESEFFENRIEISSPFLLVSSRSRQQWSTWPPFAASALLDMNKIHQVQVKVISYPTQFTDLSILTFYSPLSICARSFFPLFLFQASWTEAPGPWRLYSLYWLTNGSIRRPHWSMWVSETRSGRLLDQ